MRRHVSLRRHTPLKRDFARKLRAHATDAESKLWSILRHRQIAGLRFRRQQPIGPYVVDFYCPAAKLIVELDGGQHGEAQNAVYDERRTTWLCSQGYRVLRFPNGDVLRNPQIVLDAIDHAFAIRAVPLPEKRCAFFDPPSRGG